MGAPPVVANAGQPIIPAGQPQTATGALPPTTLPASNQLVSGTSADLPATSAQVLGMSANTNATFTSNATSVQVLGTSAQVLRTSADVNSEIPQSSLQSGVAPLQQPTTMPTNDQLDQGMSANVCATSAQVAGTSADANAASAPTATSAQSLGTSAQELGTSVDVNAGLTQRN